MNTIEAIIFYFLFFIFITGCGEDYCEEFGEDYSNEQSFKLVDKGNGRDLIIQEKIYELDSVNLQVNGISVIKYRYAGLTAEYGINEQLDLTIYNNSDYLLYLNSTDIDTLKVFANNITDRCNGQKVSLVEYILYKGDTIRSENIFILKK